MAEREAPGEAGAGTSSGDDPRRRESALAADELTIANLLAGRLGPEDVTIRRANLVRQAETARAEGYPELARNLARAAELTAVPEATLLEIYDRLRPNRASYQELLALSQTVIARFDAPETGAYIREAAEAMRAVGMLRD